MTDFRQNTDLRDLRTNRRAEAALSYLLALSIGLALAAATVAWWTA